MDLYILIARPVANTRNRFEDHQILMFDNAVPVQQQVPTGFDLRLGPAPLKDCVSSLKSLSENVTNWPLLTYLQYGLIFLVTIGFVIAILFGAWYAPIFNPPKNSAGQLINTPLESSRDLITFLVAVGSIAIAFLAVLTAMIIREHKERFPLAKDVLTAIIGILGTIVGFYFGTAENDRNTSPNISNSESQTANGNTNTNGTTNRHNSGNSTATPSNVNGVNSSASIRVLPSGREIFIFLDDHENWKLFI